MGRSKQGQETEKKRIVNRLPHYAQFEYARLGYFSLSTRETKFISKDDSLTIDGETETPGYFFGKFVRGLWMAKQDVKNGSNMSYPYKAIPGKFPSGVYIDVKQAFKQIACAFGMECFIHEGRMVAYGETTPDTPCFQDKICRGLLVTGTSKSGSYQEWINRDLRTVYFSNPSYAPHLRYVIWATLHAIQSVLNPISVYAHTDGFIVPSRHAQRAFETLDSYGFRYTIKYSGPGEIYGVANYRIGGHRSLTKNHDIQSRVYIRQDNDRWWLSKFNNGLALRNSDVQNQLYGHENTDE